MNRIRTIIGSTITAGALAATPVVLGFAAGQADAQPLAATHAAKIFADDHGGKHKERGDDKGGKGRHGEPGDDHGHHGSDD